MNKENFSSPILFLVFNRPQHTKRVLQAIKEVKPRRLYIGADGPRMSIKGEVELCIEVREIVNQEIDWDCEVFKSYNDDNLGCGKAVEKSLNWFFEHEEMGIILEDDILPSFEFFNFCSAMLLRYKDDYSVFSINGCSLGYNYQHNGDYFFSKYFNMWGWATWRRSLELKTATWPIDEIEFSLRLPQALANVSFSNWYYNIHWVNLWRNIFEMTYRGKVDTWDYQWVFTSLFHKMKIIQVSYNCSINLGFGHLSTHTKKNDHYLGNLVFNPRQGAGEYVNYRKLDAKFEIEYIAKHWNNIPILTKFSYLVLSIGNKFSRLLKY